MGRKTKIAIVAGVFVLVLGAVGAYAYDSSQKDKIADGVTIGGVDVGGMTATEAEAARSAASCWRRCATRSGSATTARAGSCTGKSLKVHADLDAAVEEALDDEPRRRPPGPPRPLRHRRRASTSRSPADVTYSQPAVNRFVRHVAERSRPRSRRTPASNASGDSLEVVAGEVRPQAARQPAHRADRRTRCSTPTPTTRSPPAPTR